ncbi:TonB family protein [Dyella telluris]|uniref:TonB family protein n=1 Tax=Dyella telluris TaxID=2763498 RepID=A0A7G8Q8X8_9GAMM|nr:TonB family protein [Dyella telluris]QNK03236.1 TonB family protein [Dyella telluris]
MKFAIAGIVALLAALATHADQGNADTWTRSGMYVTATVDVDATGKIQHMELLPFRDNRGRDLAPSLRSLAESTMAKWEFVPATLNGHPVPAHTFVNAVFEFKAHGNDLDARVVSTGNGPKLIKADAPQYPLDMIHARVQANLTLLVIVQPSGKLTDITLESAQTTHGYPAAEFFRSAKNAMASWHAQPETVQGHPIETRLRLPFHYSLDNNPNSQQPPAGLTRASDSPAAPMQTDIGTEAVALDSPLQLRPTAP